MFFALLIFALPVAGVVMRSHAPEVRRPPDSCVVDTEFYSHLACLTPGLSRLMITEPHITSAYVWDFLLAGVETSKSFEETLSQSAWPRAKKLFFESQSPRGAVMHVTLVATDDLFSAPEHSFVLVRLPRRSSTCRFLVLQSVAERFSADQWMEGSWPKITAEDSVEVERFGSMRVLRAKEATLFVERMLSNPKPGDIDYWTEEDELLDRKSYSERNWKRKNEERHWERKNEDFFSWISYQFSPCASSKSFLGFDLCKGEVEKKFSKEPHYTAIPKVAVLEKNGWTIQDFKEDDKESANARLVSI